MSKAVTPMARAGLAFSGAAALLAGACAPQDGPTPARAQPTRAADAATPVPAGGLLPTGASLAGMSDQYAQPRRGPTAAAGASSWVATAPAPAFVIATPLPPGDPPTPPPAAVANRQPAPPPAAAVPQPPAAAPAASASPATSVDQARGRKLFSDYGCGGCHIFADAGGSGGIGPSLDHNPRLTRDYVIGAVAEGRGTMPAFAGQMSAEEIALLADYLVVAARK